MTQDLSRNLGEELKESGMWELRRFRSSERRWPTLIYTCQSFLSTAICSQTIGRCVLLIFDANLDDTSAYQTSNPEQLCQIEEAALLEGESMPLKVQRSISAQARR